MTRAAEPQVRADSAPPWAGNGARDPQLIKAQALTWDVVVVGGGNAALVTALSASNLGARVIVLERSPRWIRGGNTRHTRNIRCVHQAADKYNTGPYTADELWKDLSNVGEGPSNEELAHFTVRESESVPGWMSAHGVLWQPPLAGTLHLGRTNRFFLGGGKALANTYYRLADRRGITVLYDAKVTQLQLDGPACTAVMVESGGATYALSARAVVCASGGFEANVEWLKKYWGDAADNYIIRGTPYNDGIVLRTLLDAGAASAGQERGFHAIALDARAPRFDGGIATRLDTVPFGIVVNRDGNRFYDEGEDIWPKRYATWGGHIAVQPGQIAYSFWDVKSAGLFLPPMYGVSRGDTVAAVAAQIGVDPQAVTTTVDAYNAAVRPGHFDPSGLDDCHTEGLTPPKTHWAQRLDTPPFFGIAMRPGVTFTYMGLEVDATARVKRVDGSTFTNVFAAGEIMSGNILSTGYLAGFGLTIGSVWGRHAGREAARHVH